MIFVDGAVSPRTTFSVSSPHTATAQLFIGIFYTAYAHAPFVLWLLLSVARSRTQILLNGNNVAMLVPGGSPEDA